MNIHLRLKRYLKTLADCKFPEMGLAEEWNWQCDSSAANLGKCEWGVLW